MGKSDDNIYDFLSNCDMAIGGTAFIRSQNRGELSANAEPYSAKIAQLFQSVEELDRHDDFAQLKIPASAYKKGAGKYGIKWQSGVHAGGSVIQPHQTRAAADFLKRLRGFGMLADVVGSGKTFEACVVLSELAVRGVVNSILIVSPEQVYDAWKETLENFFGLGEGCLLEVKNLGDERADFKPAGEFLSPSHPLLVKWNDFIEWHEDDVRSKLFDVIIVDEAHHLCDQVGRDANAMKLLSIMMQCKKAANKEYCLLLSATPHDGNLENMFPLYYFIESKGGVPEDFGKNLPDAAKSQAYRDGKDRYKNFICRGASTVMEFINRVKYDEVMLSRKPEFESFLLAEGVSAESFYDLPWGERYGFITDYLSKPANEKFKEEIYGAVALAYHEGILRQIMIRQPNTFQQKKKIIKNFYFHPVDGFKKSLKFKIDDEEVTFDCAAAGGDAVILKDGTRHTVLDLWKRAKRKNYEDYSYYQFEYEFNYSLLEALGDCERGNGGCGYMNDTANYYRTQLADLIYFDGTADIQNAVIPVDRNESAYARKFAKTVEILREHSGQRVLVFCDYGLRRDKKGGADYDYNYAAGGAEVCLADRLLKEIKAMPEFADRVLECEFTDEDGNSLESKFEAKKDAILIVTDARLTEGANLQSCNVIINFQVTSDPLSMDQRIGRVFRIKQVNDVTVYSLADMNALEGYVLAYFTRIGLMTSNSGDATIISGSNNEHMVTLRCKQCGSVKLLTQEDYNAFKQREGGVWCARNDVCRADNPQGTLMREMNVYDFRCSTCNTTFARSRDKEGYKCIFEPTVSMCSSGEEHDRDVYCRKICVMTHCGKFGEKGGLAACPALKIYKNNANAGDLELMLACASCALKDKCPEKCRVGVYAQAIEGCLTCKERLRTRGKSLCSPHVLAFDESWEAECPRCKQKGKKGKIRPRLARTFDVFINGLYGYSKKGDDNFCTTLLRETEKVAEIQSVLAMDGLKEER